MYNDLVTVCFQRKKNQIFRVGILSFSLHMYGTYNKIQMVSVKSAFTSTLALILITKSRKDSIRQYLHVRIRIRY
jgi:hypothetical protein